MAARLIITTQQQRQLDRSPQTLRDLLADILEVWPLEAARVTSLLRSPTEDAALGGSGIHCTGRALDLAGPKRGDLTQEHVRQVAAKINAIWQYDPKRPRKKCIVDTEHGSGIHVHGQVHENTVRRAS